MMWFVYMGTDMQNKAASGNIVVGSSFLVESEPSRGDNLLSMIIDQN